MHKLRLFISRRQILCFFGRLGAIFSCDTIGLSSYPQVIDLTMDVLLNGLNIQAF